MPIFNFPIFCQDLTFTTFDFPNFCQYLTVLAQIYIFTIYPGPKFTQPTFTQNPNLHNTKFTPDPNLHDPRFTPPQIYKTQIYTKPDIHSLNFTQNPNLHSPKFTQSQIYNTKICIKFRPNISFQGKDNPILAELDLDIFHKCPLGPNQGGIMSHQFM